MKCYYVVTAQHGSAMYFVVFQKVLEALDFHRFQTVRLILLMDMAGGMQYGSRGRLQDVKVQNLMPIVY